MTPVQDWTALDGLSEKEAKMMLRMAVAHFRVINDSVKDPMKSESYNSEGHALAAGFSRGFLISWQTSYEDKQPKVSEKQYIRAD